MWTKFIYSNFLYLCSDFTLYYSFLHLMLCMSAASHFSFFFLSIFSSPEENLQNEENISQRNFKINLSLSHKIYSK